MKEPDAGPDLVRAVASEQAPGVREDHVEPPAGPLESQPDGMAIEALYRQRAAAFSAAEARWASRERIVMHVRVATFLVAAVLFILAWRGGHARLWVPAGCVAIVGFAAAVRYHEHIRFQMRRNRLLRQINEQAVARLRRDWRALPQTHVEVPPEHQAVAADLDLFGPASLFHLVCTAGTPLGIRVLRDWLLRPASPEDVSRRQQAVAELAPHLELRQTLILEGRLLADRGRGTERFVAWAEGALWLAARPWLRWLCRGTAAAALLTACLGFCGAVPAGLAGLAFFAVVCVNLGIIAAFGGKVHDIFATSSLRRGEVAGCLRLFQLLYSMPHASDDLNAVRREAAHLDGGVLLRMRQLQRITTLAEIRHSPLFAFFVYLPLQITMLCDFHVLTLLEAWQSRHGASVRCWFVALAKLEALCSLAALAHDHRRWTMPEVDAAADGLRCRRLGHPLLPPAACVANDVEIGPAGSFLLVTGSNMSGKSTLLRAVGVNVVLAQAGAPVCAQRLHMPPVDLTTSMRIRDSLEDGVSFYMAELLRLKHIVEAAHNAASPDNRVLLYLLDEILQGTNSKERHIAVVRVMQHLLGCRAIGAVSTHDLDLATSESLVHACRCVHFRETLHERGAPRPMTFDYRLRPGVATTSNALALLKIVGLE